MTKLNLFILSILLLTLGLVGSAKSQTESSISTPQQIDNSVYKSSEVDQKAKLKKKPKPSIWNINKSCEVRAGTATVKFVLHRSGMVRQIEFLKTSCCEFFDKNVVEVIDKFKFKPALKNGQAVSQSLAMEFAYSF